MSDREKATPTIQIENSRTIVTEWRFSPGAETGWHRHQMDYVVVPMTSGTLTIETEQGLSANMLECGVSYFRERGTEHNVINNNEFEFVFVETELK